MIISLEIENYLSFNKKTVIDFTTANQKHMGLKRTVHLRDYKVRVIPIAAFVGGIFAGKSNILKAIKYVKDIVCGKITSHYSDAKISIEFLCNEIVYRLEIIGRNRYEWTYYFYPLGSDEPCRLGFFDTKNRYEFKEYFNSITIVDENTPINKNFNKNKLLIALDSFSLNIKDINKNMTTYGTRPDDTYDSYAPLIKNNSLGYSTKRLVILLSYLIDNKGVILIDDIDSFTDLEVLMSLFENWFFCDIMDEFNGYIPIRRDQLIFTSKDESIINRDDFLRDDEIFIVDYDKGTKIKPFWMFNFNRSEYNFFLSNYTQHPTTHSPYPLDYDINHSREKLYDE